MVIHQNKTILCFSDKKTCRFLHHMSRTGTSFRLYASIKILEIKIYKEKTLLTHQCMRALEGFWHH